MRFTSQSHGCLCAILFTPRANADLTKAGSDDDTDEENEEGDYTVFECPGLAPVRKKASVIYLLLEELIMYLNIHLYFK